MALLDHYMKNGNLLSEVENYCFQNILKMELHDKNITIQYIADELNVSTTTIFRMTKKLGYQSFKELRYDLLYHKRNDFKEIEYTDDIEEEMKELFFQTLQNIKSSDLDIILKSILESDSILIASTGLNNYIARILTIKLSLLGKKVTFPDDPWISFLEASKLSQNDLLIVFSREGETMQLIDTIKNAKVNNGKTLLITQKSRSSMQKLVDHTLICASEENEGFNLDTRLQMHICINYLMKKLIEYKDKR